MNRLKMLRKRSNFPPLSGDLNRKEQAELWQSAVSQIFIIVLNLSDLKSSTRGDFKLIFLLLSAYYPTIYNPNNVLRGKALCSLDQKVTHCCAKFGP